MFSLLLDYIANELSALNIKIVALVIISRLELESIPPLKIGSSSICSLIVCKYPYTDNATSFALNEVDIPLRESDEIELI